MLNRIIIRIKGKHPKNILKEIIKRHINIYKIIEKDEELYLTIDLEDYRLVKEIKTSYKISIVKYIGISRIKQIINNYKYLIIFITIGFLLTVFLSNIIFTIDINHSNKNIIKIIEKDLEELGIRKYHFIVSNKRKEIIKNKILEKEKDKIEWLEIERNGTKYIVKVEERKIKKDEDNCPPRNIISKKNAVIIEIKSSSGEILVKKNQYVEKKQVLISGLIHNKERVMTKRCAKGIVFGEVWYKINVSIPKKYIEEEKTNDYYKAIEIVIGNKKVLFPKKEQYRKVKEYNIIGSKIIPLSFKINKYQKVKRIIRKYNYNELDKLALDTVTKDFSKRLKEDENIIDKKVLKKHEKNSKIIIEVFLKVKENIGQIEDISNVNIEELNKETE